MWIFSNSLMGAIYCRGFQPTVNSCNSQFAFHVISPLEINVGLKRIGKMWLRVPQPPIDVNRKCLDLHSQNPSVSFHAIPFFNIALCVKRQNKLHLNFLGSCCSYGAAKCFRIVQFKPLNGRHLLPWVSTNGK